MLEYLKQYQQVPADLRARLSAPEVVAAVKELEAKYGLNLGAVIIRVMLKEVAPDQMSAWLGRGFNLDQTTAANLERDLREKVFVAVKDYLYGRPVPLAEENETAAAAPVAFEPLPVKPAPVQPLPAAEPPILDLEEKINKIISQAKIDFSSQDLLARFRQVLKTYLKGIRDKISAKETLVKEVTVGGLGFDLNSAEAILTLANNLNDQAAAAKIRRPGEWDKLANVWRRDAEYDLAASLKARQSGSAAVKPSPVVAPQLPPPVPSVLPRAESRGVEGPVPKVVEGPPPAVVPPTISEELAATPLAAEELLTIPVAAVEPINQLRRTESGKVKMDDILVAPKVFTPVDELRYMTLRNLRHLSQEPVRAMEIVKKKLEALAAEDYGKLVDGVGGWKLSPVNQAYVEAYRQAIINGKPVAKILAEKKKEDPATLTEAEFEAILSFNQEVNKLIH